MFLLLIVRLCVPSYLSELWVISLSQEDSNNALKELLCRLHEEMCIRLGAPAWQSSTSARKISVCHLLITVHGFFRGTGGKGAFVLSPRVSQGWGQLWTPTELNSSRGSSSSLLCYQEPRFPCIELMISL